MFVHAKLFQPSINFLSNVRASQRGAPFRRFPLGQAPGLVYKFYTTLERFALDKHSSIFWLFTSDEEKSYTTLTEEHYMHLHAIKSPNVNFTQLFFFIMDGGQNKLECWFFSNFFKLLKCNKKFFIYRWRRCQKYSFLYLASFSRLVLYSQVRPGSYP